MGMSEKGEQKFGQKDNLEVGENAEKVFYIHFAKIIEDHS